MDGAIRFDIPTPKAARRAEISIQYGKLQETLTVNGRESPSSSFIKVSTMNTEILAGDLLKFGINMTSHGNETLRHTVNLLFWEASSTCSRGRKCGKTDGKKKRKNVKFRSKARLWKIVELAKVSKIKSIGFRCKNSQSPPICQSILWDFFAESGLHEGVLCRAQKWWPVRFVGSNSATEVVSESKEVLIPCSLLSYEPKYIRNPKFEIHCWLWISTGIRFFFSSSKWPAWNVMSSSFSVFVARYFYSFRAKHFHRSSWTHCNLYFLLLHRVISAPFPLVWWSRTEHYQEKFCLVCSYT